MVSCVSCFVLCSLETLSVVVINQWYVFFRRYVCVHFLVSSIHPFIHHFVMYPFHFLFFYRIIKKIQPLYTVEVFSTSIAFPIFFFCFVSISYFLYVSISFCFYQYFLFSVCTYFLYLSVFFSIFCMHLFSFFVLSVFSIFCMYLFPFLSVFFSFLYVPSFSFLSVFFPYFLYVHFSFIFFFARLTTKDAEVDTEFVISFVSY